MDNGYIPSNELKKPDYPYRGDEPYIFVSYFYKDLDRVFPEIKRFQDMGYNIFYDENIKPTNKVSDEHLQFIQDCELFIIFVTNNATASQKAKKEFRFAISSKKPIIAIYLDDFENIDMSSGWRYELLDVNEIYKNSLDDKAYVSQVVRTIQSIGKDSDGQENPIACDVDGPYVYISHDYEDSKVVDKEIRQLQSMGCNVDYDKEFNFSDNNLILIKNCNLMVVYVSNKSSYSNWIKKEVKYAVDNEKQILPIYLENLDYNGMDTELQELLSNFRPLLKSDLDEQEYRSRFSVSLQNFGIIPKDPTNSRLIPGVGREPLPAYRGDKPYIFVSYAHKDSYRVFPEIKRFQDLDYKIWYDEGIAPANEWLENILQHLNKCKFVIVFITRNSIASVNVKKEIKYSINALNMKDSVLPIFLEDFDEINMDREWKYLLSDIQAIVKTKMSDEEYVFKCTEAFSSLGFEPFPDNLFEKIELKSPEEMFLDDALKYDVLYSDINSDSVCAYIDDFFDNLVLFDDYYNGHIYKDILKSSVDIFLEHKSFGTALDVLKTFFNVYQIYPDNSRMTPVGEEIVTTVNPILDVIEAIEKYWKAGHDIGEMQTDLFIHSVNVFLLGLAVYAENESYRELFASYVLRSPYRKFYKIEGKFSHEEFLYRWGITSLLHDIYLPFERRGKQANYQIYKEFDLILGKDRKIQDFNDLNNIYRLDPFFAEAYVAAYPHSSFLDLFNPMDLIAHKISIDFNLDVGKVLNNLNNLIDLVNETEFEEHGLVAALLVLNSYSYQIQEYCKNPDFFFYPIVDSATAIFLHNYYKYFLQKEPFNLKRFYPDQNPLAYLLILCDNISEFNKKPETVINRNVNELNLEITNRKLSGSYVVNSSSYGFSFSNELSLDDILDMDSVFEEVFIDNLTHINTDNEIFVSGDGLFSNSMENSVKIAEENYKAEVEEYNRQLYDEAEGVEENLLEERKMRLTLFDDLPSGIKVSSFRKANSIPKKLNLMGCELVNLSDERDAVTEFSEEEVLDLAKFEHERWCEEKIGQGWRYGKLKDLENLVSPYLIPWNDLDPKIRQYDMESVRSIPSIVESAGLKVVFSKLKLLTIKIHDFYEGNVDDDELFDSLSLYLKKLHYKKTELILESLAKLDYFAVDESHGNEGIVSFDKNELIYFAQDYHEEWCKLNGSIGWKFGDSYDAELKTNPNLVAWEKLSFDYAIKQYNIFKHLPKFCKEVGLKIIKNR